MWETIFVNVSTGYEELLNSQEGLAEKLESLDEDMFYRWKQYVESLGFTLDRYYWEEFINKEAEINAQFRDDTLRPEKAEDVIVASGARKDAAAMGVDSEAQPAISNAGERTFSLQLSSRKLQDAINKRLGVQGKFIPMNDSGDDEQDIPEPFRSRQEFGFKPGFMSQDDREFLSQLELRLKKEVEAILNEGEKNGGVNTEKAEKIAGAAAQALVRYRRGSLDMFVQIGFLTEKEEQSILLRKIAADTSFNDLARKLLEEDNFLTALESRGVNTTLINVYRERMFPGILINLYENFGFSHNEIALVAKQRANFVTLPVDYIKPGIEYLQSEWGISEETSILYLAKRRLFAESLKNNSDDLNRWIMKTGFTPAAAVDIICRLPNGLDLFDQVKKMVEQSDIFIDKNQQLMFAREVFYVKGKGAVGWMTRIIQEAKENIRSAITDGLTSYQIARILLREGLSALNEQSNIYSTFAKSGLDDQSLVAYLVQLFEDDIKAARKWWETGSKKKTLDDLLPKILELIKSFQDSVGIKKKKILDEEVTAKRMILLIMVKRPGREQQFLDEIGDSLQKLKERMPGPEGAIRYCLNSVGVNVKDSLETYDVNLRKLISDGITLGQARRILISDGGKDWLEKGRFLAQSISQTFEIPKNLAIELYFSRGSANTKYFSYWIISALILIRSLGGLQIQKERIMAPERIWNHIFRYGQGDPVGWAERKLRQQGVLQQDIDNMIEKIERLGLNDIKFDTVLKEDSGSDQGVDLVLEMKQHGLIETGSFPFTKLSANDFVGDEVRLKLLKYIQTSGQEGKWQEYLYQLEVRLRTAQQDNIAALVNEMATGIKCSACQFENPLYPKDEAAVKLHGDHVSFCGVAEKKNGLKASQAAQNVVEQNQLLWRHNVDLLIENGREPYSSATAGQSRGPGASICSKKNRGGQEWRYVVGDLLEQFNRPDYR